MTSVTSRNSIQILPKVANSTAIPWIVFARPKSRYNSHFTPEWLSRNLKLKIQVILYNLWCVTGTRFKNLWWVYKILSLHKKKQIISLLSFSVTPTWILYYSRVAMVTSNQCHSIFLCLIYKLWEILKKKHPIKQETMAQYQLIKTLKFSGPNLTLLNWNFSVQRTKLINNQMLFDPKVHSEGWCI